MVHELKVLPEYYDAIESGKKTFEIRKHDRDYKVGDILALREWDGKEYTGALITKEVIYILTDGSGYVLTGYVVMSINDMRGGKW